MKWLFDRDDNKAVQLNRRRFLFLSGAGCAGLWLPRVDVVRTGPVVLVDSFAEAVMVKPPRLWHPDFYYAFIDTTGKTTIHRSDSSGNVTEVASATFSWEPGDSLGLSMEGVKRNDILVLPMPVETPAKPKGNNIHDSKTDVELRSCITDRSRPTAESDVNSAENSISTGIL